MSIVNKPIVVIAAYRLKISSKKDYFKSLLLEHQKILEEEQLKTARKNYMMEGEEEVFIEVFEWKNEQSVEAAHHNTRIQSIWKRMSEVAAFVSLDSVKECSQPFPHFNSILE